MVSAILSYSDTQLKPVQKDELGRQPGLVIRVGLDGTRSVEIVASDSDEEAKLGEHLIAASPIIDLIQAAMRVGR